MYGRGERLGSQPGASVLSVTLREEAKSLVRVWRNRHSHNKYKAAREAVVVVQGCLEVSRCLCPECVLPSLDISTFLSGPLQGLKGMKNSTEIELEVGGDWDTEEFLVRERNKEPKE